MLVGLRAKASRAYQQFRNRHISPSLDVHLHIGPEDGGEDRLAIFGGQTRVMTSKLLSRKPPKVKKARTDSPRRQESMDVSSPLSDGHDHSSSSPEAAPTPTSESSVPQNVRDAFNDVHPALMDYLSLFPSSVAVVDTSKPLVDPPMSLPSPPSSAPTPDVSSFSSFSQAGASGAASASSAFSPPMLGNATPFAPTPSSSSSFSSAPDVQMQNANGFAALGDGMMDPSGWFNVMGGIAPNVAGFMENVPLGGDAAMLDEQWMNLMRDTGLLSQMTASMNGYPAPGSMSVNGNGSGSGGGKDESTTGLMGPPPPPITDGMNLLF